LQINIITNYCLLCLLVADEDLFYQALGIKGKYN
jgi:hypothetical protein